jgi:hypothetical protein
MADLLRAWPAAVGEGIAKNAQPARFQRDGTLIVHVSSSAWGFELAQLAPTILERLRTEVPELALKGLKFAPGPLPEGLDAEDDRARPTPVTATPQHEAAAAELVTAVADENLRKVIAKTAALSLARPPHDRPV